MLASKHICSVLIALPIALGLLTIGCNKHEDKVAEPDTTHASVMQDSNKGGTSGVMGAGTHDTMRSSPMPSGSNVQIVHSADTGIERPAALSDSMLLAKNPFTVNPPFKKPMQNIPVGQMPILSSKVLATLQPTIPGYIKDPKLVFTRDVKGIVSKSTGVYRNINDPTQTIRFEIIDQDERAAGPIIKELSALKASGGERTSISPEGEARTAYLTEVNGMIGMGAYIASEHVATLSLVIGDHRLIQLREEKATSRDHLIEVAKSFDAKKFEKMH